MVGGYAVWRVGEGPERLLGLLVVVVVLAGSLVQDTLEARRCGLSSLASSYCRGACSSCSLDKIHLIHKHVRCELLRTFDPKESGVVSRMSGV